MFDAKHTETQVFLHKHKNCSCSWESADLVVFYFCLQYIGAYCVSKTALVGLTKVLAEECGHMGVRINCIAPGIIKTNFSEAVSILHPWTKYYCRQSGLNNWCKVLRMFLQTKLCLVVFVTFCLLTKSHDLVCVMVFSWTSVWYWSQFNLVFQQYFHIVKLHWAVPWQDTVLDEDTNTFHLGDTVKQQFLPWKN